MNDDEIVRELQRGRERTISSTQPGIDGLEINRTAMTQNHKDCFAQSVNLGDLLMRVENDRELLCELIGLFKEDFPGLLHSLQESVARKDMKSMQMTSHALKGMLLGLSVEKAAATVSRIEQMGREETSLGLLDVLAVFEGEVANLLQELDDYTVGMRR